MQFQMDNNHQPERPSSFATKFLAPTEENLPKSLPIAQFATTSGKAGDSIRVNFVIPEDDAASGRVFAAIMEETQNLPITGEESDTPGNTLQLNAHYMAAICCFIPSLVPSCKMALNELGADSTEVYVPCHAEPNLTLLNVPHSCNQSKNLIIFGQLALLAYKNDQSASATKAILRLIEEYNPNHGTNVPVGFDDQEKVKKIRANAGCSPIFRQALLRSLIDLGKKRGSLGHLCKYLCRTIAWTDMADFVAVSDILVATNSPVLDNYKVANEVKALREALDLINNSECPQFFRILAPDADQLRLSRCKFPTLVYVAERIRGEKHFMFTQIVPSNSNAADTLVMKLVAQHKKYMRNAYYV